MSDPLLVIGNKRYSSWSLRAWIGLRMLGLSFREELISLYQQKSSAQILIYSPAGHVPILVDGGLTVHDSLAILEYANEAYAGGRLLPAETHARAEVRSICAEMHAGFPHLRESLPMNLGRESSPHPLNPQTAQEISRILCLWERTLEAHASAGPFLYGEWGMADCMYLPVATRFRAYAVDLGAFPRSAAYVDRLYGLEAFQEWRAAALEEELLPQNEL